MVKFDTKPQAPLPTILKEQLTGVTTFKQEKQYKIKIIFVDVDLGRKYAKIRLTNQIIDGDMPYIYQDRFQVGIKDYHLVIYNVSPLWNIVRKMLIKDGFLPKSDNGAILITPIELVEYLTNGIFQVKGNNIHGYKNVYAISSGDAL